MACRVRSQSCLGKQENEYQQKGMQGAVHGCILLRPDFIALAENSTMPELPEVETTRRGLEPRLQGKILEAVKIRDKRLRWPIPGNISAQLAGKRLLSIRRRGKYLLFDFGGIFQIVHLGMSGSLRFVSRDEPPAVHDHVDWLFEGEETLRLRDPRRFGAVLLIDDPANHPLLAHLGPEPLTAEFDGEYLYKACRGRKTSIKNLIMDSRVVVGVGNIYASESLFRAGIRPGRAAGRLTRAECAKLAAAIKTTLQNAVKAGGSSLRDYVTADGELGYFQLHTKVYDRVGLPCKVCGAPIKKLTSGQRATYYCPVCQK
jgi:formamidopyrimidine-DNA glycosylase